MPDDAQGGERLTTCAFYNTSDELGDCCTKKNVAAADLIENQQNHIAALLQAPAALRDTILRRDKQIEDMKRGMTQFAKAVAEKEEVVLCKDCKHYLVTDEFEGGKRYVCDVNHFSYINNDGDMHFCSYGERREPKK